MFAAIGMAIGASRTASSPADELAAARVLSNNGSSREAARHLETWLAAPPRLASPADIAGLGLEMAKDYLVAGDTARARTGLDQVERATRSIVHAPTIAATLRREAARIAELMMDFPRAETLLAAAARDFQAEAPGYAAEAENALGSVELELSRPEKAVLAFQLALSTLDRLRAPPTRLVPALVNLTKAALSAGDIDLGTATASRTLQVADGDPRLVRAAKLSQAELFLRQVDLPRAEAALHDISDPSTATRDDIAGQALYTEASALYQRGQLTEADQSAEAALDVLASYYGPDHPAVARTLHLLGLIQDLLGDTHTALAFLARAEAIDRQTFGQRSVRLGASLADRARVELDAGQTLRAEATARSALSILADPWDRNVRSEGMAHIVLAVARLTEGDPKAAEQQFLLAEQLITKGFGPKAPELGYLLIQYGRLLTDEARYNDAKTVLTRALRLYDETGGAIRMRAAEAQAALATLDDRTGNRSEALDHSRQAEAILLDLQRSGTELPSTDGELQQRSARQLFLDHATLLLAAPADDPETLDEAFRTSQRAQQSRASEAIRLASARLAAKHNGLAKLLRARSDNGDALRQAEFLLRDQVAHAGMAAEREEAGLRDIARQRRAAVLDLDEEIKREYPRFAQFSGAEPVALAGLQQALHPDELVLMPLVGERQMLLWAVTSHEARAVPVPLSRSDLHALVARVRAGLDLRSGAALAVPPPFDLPASIALYHHLIAPVADLVGSRSTIIYIPDDVLQSLPLQTLADPEGDWLIRHAAIEVMPSVAGLVSLRNTPPSASPPPKFLGIGDPVEEPADLSSPKDSPGRALRVALQALPRLPETRDELRRMARSYPEDASELLLGDNATTRNLLNENLASFQVIAFATHAVMAGELPSLTEPAIVLSSAPGDASEGLLKASRVAALDVQADLVILSACNTDAPESGPFADGLSGLARAFLYAGARSLLVSHWRVGSLATVPLTTGFVDNLSAVPPISKPEALRKSMLHMIDSDDPILRHPSSWAAFSLVGE